MKNALFSLLLALPLAASGQIIGLSANNAGATGAAALALALGAGSGAADPRYSISGTISPAANGSGVSVNLTGLTPALVQSAPGEAPDLQYLCHVFGSGRRHNQATRSFSSPVSAAQQLRASQMISPAGATRTCLS